jgi:hypothetical protein
LQEIVASAYTHLCWRLLDCNKKPTIEISWMFQMPSRVLTHIELRSTMTDNIPNVGIKRDMASMTSSEA